MSGRHNKDQHEYTAIAQVPSICDNDGYEATIDVITDTTTSLPRSLTIDYSKQQKRIHVLFPSLFVWFLSVSVSTPLLVLGSTLPNERTPLVCGVVNFDPENNELMQYMFIAVRIAVPAVCLLFTFISILWTILSSYQLIKHHSGLDEDVQQLMRLATLLTMFFVLFSAQRIIGSSFFEVWTRTPFMLSKYPLMDRGIAVVLVMLHWSGSAIRPFAYLLADLDVRDEVRVTLGCGQRKKRRAKAVVSAIEL